MLNHHFTVKLTEKEREGLAQLAAAQERSAGGVLRYLLRQALNEHQTQQSGRPAAQSQA